MPREADESVGTLVDDVADVRAGDKGSSLMIAVLIRDRRDFDWVAGSTHIDGHGETLSCHLLRLEVGESPEGGRPEGGHEARQRWTA